MQNHWFTQIAYTFSLFSVKSSVILISVSACVIIWLQANQKSTVTLKLHLWLSILYSVYIVHDRQHGTLFQFASLVYIRQYSDWLIEAYFNAKADKQAERNNNNNNNNKNETYINKEEGDLRHDHEFIKWRYLLGHFGTMTSLSVFRSSC